jgi:hypothetical protein
MTTVSFSTRLIFNVGPLIRYQITREQRDFLKRLKDKVSEIVKLPQPSGFGLGSLDAKEVARGLLVDATPQGNYSFTDTTDDKVSLNLCSLYILRQTDILIKGNVVPYGNQAVKGVLLSILAEMPDGKLVKGEPAAHGSMALSASLVCLSFSRHDG